MPSKCPAGGSHDYVETGKSETADKKQIIIHEKCLKCDGNNTRYVNKRN